MPRIPYGKQYIDEDDVKAVSETLLADFLTTGPKIGEFESSVADFCGATHGIAVANGTAALHAAMFALDIGPGDEVIVPPMTFAASANCVLYMGATPVFADVDPNTLLLDPAKAAKAVTPRTKAIIGVDYAGQPCDWTALRLLADQHNLALVADSCHALGATLSGVMVGTLADMSIFSFHPVKHVATGEGGMILTEDDTLASRLKLFRNHGITTNARSREEAGAWFYEMTALGYNYRMTDIQAALGVSQMTKLPDFLTQRRDIAKQYDERFSGTQVSPLRCRQDVEHAYHLYVVQIPRRDEVYKALRAAGIFAQVHYIPVHLHPYYRDHLGTKPGLCPVAEAAFENILSIPMYPKLTDEELDYVATTLLELI